jgi:hypothetical protein
MKRFVEGEDRRQATLLPDWLDDSVTEDNPVRIVEAFIDELDLAALGCAGDDLPIPSTCMPAVMPERRNSSSGSGSIRAAWRARRCNSPVDGPST